VFLFGECMCVCVRESESVLFLYIRAGQVVYIAFRQFRVSFFLSGGWWKSGGFCGPIGDPIVVAISGQGLYK